MKKNIDILHWSERLNKRVYLPSKMLLDFQFNGESFIVAQEGKFFYVCIMREEKPIVVYRTQNEGNSPGSVALEFRKKFIENKTTKEQIEKFIEDPIGYAKKRGR